MSSPNDNNNDNTHEVREDLGDYSESGLIILEEGVRPNVSNSESGEQRIKKVLNGLRGLASLHILMFHCLLYSTLHINILGSVEMPLFFLLSGYSLALAYGRKHYDGCKSCCCSKKYSQVPDDPAEPVLFNTFSFYRNRFARIMPMYFIANFVVAAPLIAFGYGIITLADEYFTFRIIFHIIGSIFPILMILPGLTIFWSLSGPAWTVSTLWFFYLFFPVLLPRLQRVTYERSSKWIVYLDWIQLVIGIILLTIFHFFTLPVPILDGYWISTGWGASRLPVFVMGIFAGLLRLNDERNPHIGNRSDCINILFAFIPFISKCNSGGGVATERTWARLVTWISALHVLLIVVIVILDIFVGKVIGDLTLGGFMNVLVQFSSVHSFLIVIDGLTKDGGKSLLSRTCESTPLQQLGRMSMTLYMIHESLIHWLCVAVKGNLNGLGKVPDRNIMPSWGIPIVVLVSLLLAWVLTKFVEEPLRKLIRTPKD